MDAHVSMPAPTHETHLEAHFGDRVIRCIADRPPHVVALLDAAVASRPDGEAFVFEAERLTWREAGARIGRIAGVLAAQGVGQRDRVGLLLGNGLAFPLILLALARLGAIAVPISHRSQRAELTYMLVQCGATMLVHEAELEDQVPLAGDVPTLVRCIESSELMRLSGQADVLAAEPPPVPPIAEEDTALLVYTSGTTGRPKGAMITHLNLVHAAIAYEQCMQLTSRERTIVSVPLTHVTGITGALCVALRCASTLIVMRSFKAIEFIALAARERMTHTVMVPAMYNLCLLQPTFADADLRSWRVGGYGGAPMPPATIEAIQSRLPALQLMNCYGATETAMPIAIMPAHETGSHPDRVGRIVPCAEVAIVDDRGREVPVGEHGELWIKGPSVVRGYWDDPAETARNFTGGFWHSGDIGSLSPAGHLGIHDRIKDMINRGGYKIFTTEVENVVCAHPAVVEAAVIGRPCPVLGERVHAFVVLKQETTAEALKDFCRASLSDYKVPEGWTLQFELLPRNANGKLLKRDLRERLPIDPPFVKS